MERLERVCADAGATFSYVTDDLAEGRMLLQARRDVLPSLEVLGTWLTTTSACRAPRSPR